MSTQAQGKGKKKSKEVTKVSLEEFNQIDAPHGHAVVSLKMTGLDWAETMADHDQQAAEIQQIIVPSAPRAQRGPNVDYNSLPDEPPFRVSVYNLPMSVEEKELRERFFQGIDVVRVDASKASTTVELGSKDALFEALGKDGLSVKNRTVNVCLFGQSPPNNFNNDRYAGRSNDRYGDRYGDRGQERGGFGGSRMGDRYSDRMGGGGGGGGFRDRDNFGGFSRGGGGGFGGPPRGYERDLDRGSYRDASRGPYASGGGEQVDEPDNWRSRPAVKPQPPAQSYNGSRQPYNSRYEPPQEHSPHRHQGPPESYYQHPRFNPHHNQPPNHMPSSQFDRFPNNRPSADMEERPKLNIAPRKVRSDADEAPSVRNEAIFGQAKPSSKPYEKMKEIEEKLMSVQVSDSKSPKGGSQAGSQPGSAPRSRQISERSSRD